MNNFPSKAEVEMIRQAYPAGTRVELTSPLDDPFSKLTTGDKATIFGVDDAGNILCRWDSGSSLNLILGDKFRIIPALTDIIYEQIMAIRATGKVNMLDTTAVQRLAYEMDFYELVNLIEDDRKSYWNFILTGKQK